MTNRRGRTRLWRTSEPQGRARRWHNKSKHRVVTDKPGHHAVIPTSKLELERTRGISHGEMVRTTTDPTLTISACRMRYLYQGRGPHLRQRLPQSAVAAGAAHPNHFHLLIPAVEGVEFRALDSPRPSTHPNRREQ